MRHFTVLPLLIGFVLSPNAAWSQVAERYQLREDFRLGLDVSYIIRTAELLPRYKRYFQLTLEQQALMRTWYSGMRVVDAPPYPESGVGFYNDVMQLTAKRLGVHGSLALEIGVNAEGKTTSVRIIKAPSDEIATLARISAKNMKFTPAQCESLPCAMSFPIGIFLVGD